MASRAQQRHFRGDDGVFAPALLVGVVGDQDLHGLGAGISFMQAGKMAGLLVDSRPEPVSGQ
jgi:hypothetical protein